MRILAICGDVPFPPVTGGQRRTFQLLAALTLHHEVTLAAFSSGGEQAAPPFPIRVISVPWTAPPLYAQMHSADASVSARAYQELLADKQPWFVSCYECEEMEFLLRELGSEKFDLMLIENTHMGRFVPLLSRTVPKVLDLHDVHSLMQRREGESLETERTRAFEQSLFAQCQWILACSEFDADAVRCLAPVADVTVVPNGVDTQFFRPAAAGDPRRLLFIGTLNYRPNSEGITWFVREILPRVETQYPSIRLSIVGSNPGQDVLGLSSDRVEVHASVPDMRPYYSKCGVVIVPLLGGGGTRLKILEAAASGKAIVSTAVGAEGLDFDSHSEIVVADSPQEFADAVVALIKDDDRRSALGSAARARALTYDWRVIFDRFDHEFARRFGPGSSWISDG